MSFAPDSDMSVANRSLTDAFQTEFERGKQSSHLLQSCPCISKNLDAAAVGNALYDVMTACISIADIVTDIWVLSNFYRDERWTFFTLSLIILIFAQISYAIAFVAKFVQSEQESVQNILFWFCIGLLLSPFMSFIFYFTSDANMPLSKFFKSKLGLHIAENRLDSGWHEIWATKQIQEENEKSKVMQLKLYYKY